MTSETPLIMSMWVIIGIYTLIGEYVAGSPLEVLAAFATFAGVTVAILCWDRRERRQRIGGRR